MTSIHVDVTAADLEVARTLPRMVAWSSPIEAVIARQTGQDVDIDGDGKSGCIATIGQGAWTLVIELPEVADAWLDRRWQYGAVDEPIAFDIEIPDWILSLVGS